MSFNFQALLVPFILIFFTSIVKNTVLNGLIGGVENVTVGDRLAKDLQRKNKTGFSKVAQQRSGPPVFDVIIELIQGNLHEWKVIKDVARAVDNILAGKEFKAEIRRRDPYNTGKMCVELIMC